MVVQSRCVVVAIRPKAAPRRGQQSARQGPVNRSECVEVGGLVRDLLCVPPRDPSFHTLLAHNFDMKPIPVLGTEHL